jgi:hypothetical protein
MARQFPDPERHRLLSAWCDGSLSDDQIDQLDELLRSDPEFRAFYVEYMDQHAALAAGAVSVGDHLLPNGADSGETLGVEPKGGCGGGRRPRVFAARSWPWVAAAALLLIGVAGWLRPMGKRGLEQVGPGVGPVAGPPTAGPPLRLAHREGFAVVLQLDGAEWEPTSGREPSEGEVLSTRRLALKSGRITLGLLSGVMLTLEGPADLDLLAVDRVHCRRGRLRTRVPAGAEGFLVSTPGSAVVDRGTEFGLNVADDGKAQVMVFEGSAEAAVLNASGSPQRSQQIVQPRAFTIDPQSGQIEKSQARREDFVLPPSLSAPPLALHPSYRGAVLEAAPRGYWRFEAMEGSRVVGEVAGGPSLRATGPVHLAVAGPGNSCAQFGSDGTEQCLTMDGLWVPPRDPGYAIELWVLPERIGHAALASLIEPGPPRDDYKHLSLVELTASDRYSMLPPGSPPASVRFLHRWPPGDSGGDNLFSSKYYVPYRWHHLVAQRNGGRMELYMDGELTQPVPLQPGVATEACQLVIGRLKPEPRLPGWVHSRPFIGRIDELALYDRPLSAEEVRRHYELGAGRPHPEPIARAAATPNRAMVPHSRLSSGSVLIQGGS